MSEVWKDFVKRVGTDDAPMFNAVAAVRVGGKIAFLSHEIATSTAGLDKLVAELPSAFDADYPLVGYVLVEVRAVKVLE